MKYRKTFWKDHPRWSLPVRGAWIEINASAIALILDWSLPVRGAWIEIHVFADFSEHLESLPVRGAWIEICERRMVLWMNLVAPRKGSVD